MDIQVYATDVKVNMEDGTVSLWGVEMGDLINQLNARDVLEVMETSDIMEFMSDDE